MIKFDLPDDKALARKIIDAQAEHATMRQEMGLLGIVFGGASNKPGNIAGFAIALATLMIVITILAPPAADLPRRELLVLFGGIFTSALGFLFGHSKKN